MLLGLFVAVYVVVALLNYSVVQSLAGSVVSDRLSRASGGTVRIGSLGCNPFNHLVLRDVLLVTPADDTVCSADRVACRFSQFPFDDMGLAIDRVVVENTYYHLKIDSAGLNLRYLIDLFASEKEKEDDETPSDFRLMVNDLRLVNVHYCHDLKQSHPVVVPADRVDIPHMDYDDINGHIRNIRVVRDNVTCHIDQLTTREKSGMEVRQMSMHVYVNPAGIAVTDMLLETAHSRLEGDVLLDFVTWKTMKHYCDSVYMTCHFLPGSWGNPREAAYWTEALRGMDATVKLDGYFTGPVQNLHADDVHLAFGDSSTVHLDASIYGLPNIDTTVIWGDIHQLHTTYADLVAVKHPSHVTIKAPELLEQLHTIDMTGRFNGTIRDFTASVALNSAVGDLDANLSLALDPVHKQYRYKGNVFSNNLKIGHLAPNEWVSQSGLELTFDGNGFDPKTMTAQAQGRLYNAVLKGQRLAGEVNVSLDANDGKVGADFCMADQLADITAHADVEWQQNGPVYSAWADLAHVDLAALGFWNREADTTARLDGRLEGRYINVTDSRVYARASLQNVHLQTSTIDYRLGNARVTLQEMNKYKTLKINSDILEGRMLGYYEWGSLAPMVPKFVDDYWLQNTGSHQRKSKQHKHMDYDAIVGTSFDATLEWIDRTDLLATFVPQLALAQGTSVQLNYNFAEPFKVIVRSDSVRYGNLALNRVFVSGDPVGQRYRVRVESSELAAGALMLAENAQLAAEMSHADASLDLGWRNSNEAIGDGDLHFRIVADTSALRLLVGASTLELGGEQWHLVDNGRSYLDGSQLFVDALGLVSDDQSITLKASVRQRQDDEVSADFHNFSLANLEPFLANTGVSAAGSVDGQVSLGGLNATPFMSGNMVIDDLRFNGQPLGNAHLVSTWNAELNQLNLFVSTHLQATDKSGAITYEQPVWLNGYLTLGQESPELDFEAEFEDFDLASLQPFVQSFSSRFEGSVDGSVSIGGTLKAPDFGGYLVVDKGLLQVDFLDVAYSFSDTIVMDSGAVRFDRFRVFDPLGNSAEINGSIHHSHLQEMRLDLLLQTDKLLCMNTKPQGTSYYGTVLAAATGTVSGPFDDIVVSIDASTLPGSALYIPISDAKQVQTADYIHFTNADDDFDLPEAGDTESVSPSLAPERKRNRYRLEINVSTTPDLTLNLPMDFSNITADIAAKGNGDLQMVVSDNVPFSLIGNYEMESGTMELNALGLLTKDFTIDEGSSIVFPGAISEARYDIRAVYSQRVNMSSLTGSLSSESQKQIIVENIIELTGQLQNPTINFDIRLPNADQSVQEEVFAYIDASNERDMLNQTMSLLLFNRFYNSSTTTADQGAATLANNGYSLVANSLGSVVSNMVEFVDINFDYKSGNGLTTDQYAVDISKQWNKFYFESTFGYGGMAREMSNVNNNTLTGDMLVGYKINPQWHLFVFNRSNTNDYTRSDLPYKQGLGIKYTRDFDTFRELFEHKKKSKP